MAEQFHSISLDCISFHILFAIFFAGSREPGAYPSIHWAKGRVDPGHRAPVIGLKHRDRQTHLGQQFLKSSNLYFWTVGGKMPGGNQHWHSELHTERTLLESNPLGDLILYRCTVKIIKTPVYWQWQGKQVVKVLLLINLWVCHNEHL